MVNNFKNKAFTLAEVLITLMIIGILALVTIPSLIQSWEEREAITKLKKTYAMLQQAFKMAEIDNGSPDTWNLTVSTTLTNLIPYLPVLKDCKNQDGCVYTGMYKTLNGVDYVSIAANQAWSGYRILLKDNTSIFTASASNTCALSIFSVNGSAACMNFMVDINGLKGPNVAGRDLFFFSMTKDGIMPWGGSNVKDENDQKLNRYPHSETCVNKNYAGYGCARWIIERSNMDYLHENTTW